MGCEVTSVYADEVIGKISYSEDILQDMVKRDYSQPFQCKDYLKLSKNVNHIYGFQQSYCQSFLFCTVIDQIQYLVYNTGRYLIKAKSFEIGSQVGLSHEDIICAVDLNENMCAVGLNGGLLIVWDLKYDQIKIKIKLPSPSVSFSSVSLNKKYVFCTDTTLPSNICYCFSVQTSKLLGYCMLPSIEPTLGGIGFWENHHVTICADGLWFMRYSQSQSLVEPTKGMFTHFPKTSQSSLCKVQNKYIVSGGVDGYVYVWNRQYCCIKVVKCFDKSIEIVSLAFTRGCLILSGVNSKIKLFMFTVKEKWKDKEETEKYDDVEYSLSEAYDEAFPSQCFAISQNQPRVYFSASRGGSLKTQIVPSNQPLGNKLRSLSNKQYMRYCRKGESFIERAKDSKQVIIVNVYPLNSKTFVFDRLQYAPKQTTTGFWTLRETRKISTLERDRDQFYSFCLKYESLVYLRTESLQVEVEISEVAHLQQGHEPINGSIKKYENYKKIYVSFCFADLTNNLQMQSSVQQEQESPLLILDLLKEEELIGVNYVEVKNRKQQNGNSSQGAQKCSVVYLIVTCTERIYLFLVKVKKDYELYSTIKCLPKKYSDIDLENQGTKLTFDGTANFWKQVTEIDELQEKKIHKVSKQAQDLHGARLKDIDIEKGISIGGSSIMIQKFR